MSQYLLFERAPESIQSSQPRPFSTEAQVRADRIVTAVRDRGDEAVLAFAREFGELREERALFSETECRQAIARIAPETVALLERSAARVRAFASAQRSALSEVEISIPGGAAGHRIVPLQRAGCYVPGGRYPLVSSLLMSVVTARVAGVEEIWVSTPRPSDEMLAAAAIAGATGVFSVGGAHGIAALALGFAGVAPCDCIVGPGNSYVTAAKFLVSAHVRIDMLAGPSELVVIADRSSSPALIAADLLAQAEHDPEAVPTLITLDRAIISAVSHELERQLADLSSAPTARVALQNGCVVVVPTIEEAARVSNVLAPEHLQLSLSHPERIVPMLKNYGGLFVGEGSAEVIGDYCAGPNHVLPTGGTGRSRCGLSVFDFIKVATWLRIDDRTQARNLYTDACWLAELEGLPGHRAAAEGRINH